MSQQPSPPPPAARRRLSAGAIASFSGLGVLLLFIFQNTQDVRLHFLFWTLVWPMWLYTIVVAVFGAITWLGLGVLRRHRRRVARRDARYD